MMIDAQLYDASPDKRVGFGNFLILCGDSSGREP